MSIKIKGLVGYSDRWSGTGGERVGFYVSSEHARYDVELVRLIHGDISISGPGLKYEKAEPAFQATYPGRHQSIEIGSYGRIPLAGLMEQVPEWSIKLWTWPSMISEGRRVIVSCVSDGSRGISLVLENGELVVEVNSENDTVKMPTGYNLLIRTWYCLVLTWDGHRSRLFVHRKEFSTLQSGELAKEIELSGTGAWFSRILLSCEEQVNVDGSLTPSGFFNGKIGDLALYRKALNSCEVAKVMTGLAVAEDSVVGEWDFTKEMSTDRLIDLTINKLHGVLVNRPQRAVTGALWNAECQDWKECPRLYNAAYFHDDDLEDAGWEMDFEYEISPTLRSGVYAMRLSASDEEEFLPFVITPADGVGREKIAVLLPTVSYMVYGNMNPEVVGLFGAMAVRYSPEVCVETYNYLRKWNLKSCYDLHSDGSGIAYASMLRPVLTTMRPTHRERLYDAPHQLGADLYIIDFLEAHGIGYDVITDHELHSRGAGLLSEYKAVISGTHCEYWTEEMMRGLGGYLDRGGRFIYLSGNGLYWVTALDEAGKVAEIRRKEGTRAWQCEPGESYLSLNGKDGGIWRFRGLAPQKLVGVGFATQGLDRGAPFKRTAESYSSKFDFLFDGVEGELIGDHPSLVLGHGAGAIEVDRIDMALGTPAHATVLASTTGFSDNYQYVIEEILATNPWCGGLQNPEVRGDIVFFDCINNGAVFAAPSIGWCYTLSYNRYNNNVAKLTENAIRAFSERDVLPTSSREE